MIGAIAGDVIGSPFEGFRVVAPGFELFGRASAFTDDTVCTVAIAHALLTGDDMAATVRTFVRRHPNRGYGALFERWARSSTAGPYGSWGNGAPMRTSAVGWLSRSVAEAELLAASQARISHDHPEAVAAAQAVSLSIYLLRTGERRVDVRAAIATRFGYELCGTLSGPIPTSAAATTQAALNAAFSSDTWEAAVRRVVELGGDTDTSASIAGAVAEVLHGVPERVAATALGYLTDDLLDVVRRFRASCQGTARTQAAPDSAPVAG